MAFSGYDHIDLRVPSLALVESFYQKLLPRLGLTRKNYATVSFAGAEWDEGTEDRHNAVEFYEEVPAGSVARFIGIIEEEGAQPSRSRIAFAVAPESLGEWEGVLREIGARDVERNPNPEYAAIFFSDPGGTRLEVCARLPRP